MNGDSTLPATPTTARSRLVTGLLATGASFGATAIAAQAASWWPLVGAAGAGAVAWLVGRTARSGGDAGTDSAAGARLMVDRVVPVWQRHVEASKGEADKGINELLQRFSSLSDGLSAAASHTSGEVLAVRAGATDELIEEHRVAIDGLLQPMQQAHAQRQSMLQQLLDLDEELRALQQLAKEVRQLAAHTNLVALNASIEAHRAGRGGEGFTVVAQEVRALATQSDRAGAGLAQRIQRLTERIDQTRERAQVEAIGDEELTLRARLQAREVVGLLVKDLSRSLQSSRELQALSVRMNADIEQIFMGFQFQDRLSQMLDAIGQDMQRFAQWVAEHEDASPADAARWLEDLERSYTMEEQRNHHHGTVEIQRSAGVDFF